jgi:hypothetical protein
MKYDFVIGIDPDCEKNGVAIVCPATRELNCECLTFAETIAGLQGYKYRAEVLKQSFIVVIEAGWLNRSNWHTHGNAKLAAAIGRSTGMNHQTGILLAQMCDYYKIPYKLQKPLKKCWKGKDGKITHAELVKQLQLRGYTDIPKRTNQEQRDAVLLII